MKYACTFTMNSLYYKDIPDYVFTIEIECPVSTFVNIKKLAYEQASFQDIPSYYEHVKNFTIKELGE